MTATHWENLHLLNRLPYPCKASEWNDNARHQLVAWWESPSIDIEIAKVTRLMTHRYPRFRDYDLAARLRASSQRRKLTTGCQGDIAIDGCFGMHMSNSGHIYSGMLYGRTAAVVTVRCYEGHASHFSSWLLPTEMVSGEIQDRIIIALGGSFHTPKWQLQHAFDTLAKHLG